mgnify:FL=1|tara:strand:+ start:393 stop:521 length:129 start_codon:yes stop_codon:yes gene_type:complete
MTKQEKPKKETIEEKSNIITNLIKKLIGTRDKKTFWDWLTSK